MKLKLKPASADLKIINPDDFSILPADGAEVEYTAFWARRIADKDAIEAKDAPAPVAETAPKS